MATSQCDPHDHINAGAWFVLDESERTQLIRRPPAPSNSAPNETIHPFYDSFAFRKALLYLA